MAVPVLENKFSNSSDSHNSSLSTTISGIVAGELLLAIASCATLSSTTTRLSMTGWTKHIEYAGTTYNNCAIFWKKAVGGETSAVVSLATAAEAICHVFRISGANTISPFDVIVHGVTASTSSVPTVAAVTPTVDNTLCFSVFQGVADANFSASVTALSNHPPWVFGTYENAAGAIGDCRSVYSTQAKVTASTTGNCAYNMTAGFKGHELTLSIKEGLTSRRIFIS